MGFPGFRNSGNLGIKHRLAVARGHLGGDLHERQKGSKNASFRQSAESDFRFCQSQSARSASLSNNSVLSHDSDHAFAQRTKLHPILCATPNVLCHSVVISALMWHSCQDRAAPDMPLSRNIVLLLCACVVTITSIGMNSFSLFLRPIEAEFGGRGLPPRCRTCLACSAGE